MKMVVMMMMMSCQEEEEPLLGSIAWKRRGRKEDEDGFC